MIERQWCPVDYYLARGFRPIVDSPMPEDTGHPPGRSGTNLAVHNTNERATHWSRDI